VAKIPLSVEYESKSWKIYYFQINDFETELKDFLIFLESIDKSREEVVSITTNVGWVKTSLLMGSSFTGVKGYAVMVMKNVESVPDPSGIKITYPTYQKQA
jgi:hypothetical protein